MVQLATCSYGEFKPEMGTPVRISLGNPKWFRHPIGYSVWSMTPRWSYMGLDLEEYLGHYVSQLERHGAREMQAEFEKITRLAGREPLVLLCFEKLNANHADGYHWCHRSLFARWWLETTGEEIPELGGVPDLTPSAAEPDTLF